MAVDTNIQLVDLNKLYPIGAVYITATNMNPSTFLNIGTWSLICNGRMIMGADSTDKGLETGGSMSKSVPLLAHTHAGPSHTHSVPNHAHGFGGKLALFAENSSPYWIETTLTNYGNLYIYVVTNTANSANVQTAQTGNLRTTTTSSGACTTGASGTGNTGSTGTANATMDVTNSYIKLFIWQRTA